MTVERWYGDRLARRAGLLMPVGANSRPADRSTAALSSTLKKGNTVMKRARACSLLAALSVVVAPFASAQSQGMGGMDMKGDMKGMDMKSDKKGMSQTHKGSGTVSQVDPQKGTLTIAHGPIESMKWPAMTMTFKAKDKAMLDKVKPGDKIDFTFTQSGKDYVVSEIR